MGESQSVGSWTTNFLGYIAIALVVPISDLLEFAVCIFEKVGSLNN